MIEYSSKSRSRQQEIMDDFHFQGAEMKILLSDLKRVNRWLGGNSVTIGGIASLISQRDGPFVILDVGCGDGEMARVCARYFRKRKLACKIIGIDANEHIIAEARSRSEGYEELEFRTADVMNKESLECNYDIAVCTLFLHHFDNEQVEDILRRLANRAKLGVVVNDLHRSRFAIVLFKFVSILLLRTKTARIDGLISIARGFKRKELRSLAELLDVNYMIKWRWAFRYQIIIRKKNES